MFHRPGGTEGLGDGPVDRENSSAFALGAGMRAVSRSGENGSSNGSGIAGRDAVKRIMRQRSVLGNITNAQPGGTLQSQQPQAKRARTEPVPDIDTMSRLPLDGDFEPMGAAERLFHALDAHTFPLPRADPPLACDVVPETPEDTEPPPAEPFDVPDDFFEICDL